MDSSAEIDQVIVDAHLDLSEKEIDVYAINRMSICRSCDQLKHMLPICKQCKCFMPVKTRIKFTHCPLGKW